MTIEEWNDIRCFYRYDARTTQIFLYADALDLSTPAIKMRLQKYDRDQAPGHRVVSMLDVYIPTSKFLRFTQDVLSSRYAKIHAQRVKQKQAGGFDEKNAKPYFIEYGGSESDGKITSRYIQLIDDTYGKTTFAFNAVCIEGARGENNRIMPKSGAKPTANIYINIPDDDLKELVLVGDAYIKAFIQSDLERRLDALRELRASGGIRAEDEDREGGFYVST